MFPLKINMFIHTLFIVFTLSCVYSQDRKITSQLNPDCTACTSDDTLIYIRAEGTDDTIHQIWDFTHGVPTVIFAVASVNSSLNIKWSESFPIMFNISEKPTYSFGMAIDKLIEYDDCEDNGHIDSKCPRRAHPLHRLSWRRIDMTRTDQEAMIRMHGHYRELRPDTIDVKLDLLPFKDYAVDLPHLIHTANSTLFDISLVNLTTWPAYNASRFALHFVLVSTDGSNDTMHYTMRKSLDDEHTPGVFEIIEIKTPECVRAGAGGFLQFRPVAYTQPERGVTTSTNAHVSTFNKTSMVESKTLRAFYRDVPPSQLLVQDMLVSFGEAGDGFYAHHNFTAWSFTVGYGAPPIEGFSFFVIMIISIGLGVPIVLALSGVIFVLVRRYKQRNPPTRFTDDD